MIYAVLIIFGLAVPFALGAWAGARYDAGVCVLVCIALIGVLIGVPFLLLEVLPRNAIPGLVDLVASVALISFLGSSVMVSEFTAGVFYGRKNRMRGPLAEGIQE